MADSQSTEFEIKSSHLVSPSPSPPSRKRLRVLSQTDDTVSQCFVPGGNLDPLTSDGRWISQSSTDFICDVVDDLINPRINPNEFNEGQHPISSPQSAVQGDNSCTPDYTSTKPLTIKVLEIIRLAREMGDNELDDLRKRCLNMEDELCAVQAQRDSLSQNLIHEQDRIRLLEIILNAHNIPFPM